jgi:hypothetical protein
MGVDLTVMMMMMMMMMMMEMMAPAVVDFMRISDADGDGLIGRGDFLHMLHADNEDLLPLDAAVFEVRP